MLKPDHIVHSDNLRLVSAEKVPAARAALKFHADVEAGTARVSELAPGGTAISIGRKVVYRSLSGIDYDAEIVFVRSKTVVDLDVTIPGCAAPTRLSRIKFQGG